MSADRFRRAQWRVLLATMFCYLFYYTGRQTFGFAIPGIQRELAGGSYRSGATEVMGQTSGCGASDTSAYAKALVRDPYARIQR